MGKISVVKFRQILAWLATELMFGRAHYDIARELGRVDSTAETAFRTASRFFALTRGAHADMSVLGLARIFDRAGAVSIHKLLSAALKEAGTFKHATAMEVRKTVKETTETLKTLQGRVTAVEIRRNETPARRSGI